MMDILFIFVTIQVSFPQKRESMPGLMIFSGAIRRCIPAYTGMTPGWVRFFYDNTYFAGFSAQF